MDKKSEQKTTSVHFKSVEVYTQFKATCVANHENMGDVIEQLLGEYVKKNAKAGFLQNEREYVRKNAKKVGPVP